MHKIMTTVIAAAMLVAAGPAQAGCYRLGESGYHWYRSCIGPGFLYPHHRYCSWRGGYRHCWYG